MIQFGLPFDWPAAETTDDFFVTDANRDAVALLERPGSWPVSAAILTGPRKSGRSLLGRIFAATSGGSLIDDAEHYPDSEIFHRWNEAQEARRPLLIIAMLPPPQWKVRLPDLASRLSATPRVAIGAPDPVLAAMLLEKWLAMRGLLLPGDVARFVVDRAERSYVSLLRIADMLDAAALSQQRAITINLARGVLSAIGSVDAAREVS